MGNAYVPRGMSYALEVLGAEVIVQMDAGFRHDPADAQKLLSRLVTDETNGENSADITIGSRYIVGGVIDQHWSRSCQLLSRWGNRLAR